MVNIDDNTIKISVRNLVEFILRSGDIDSSRGGLRDVDAMKEGTRIHKKIQKSMGPSYSSEVSLSISIPISVDDREFNIVLEGRADGIIQHEHSDLLNEPSVTIDEIKGMYQDINKIIEPIQVHKAQVMCYAYIYAKQNKHENIGIRLTYCNLETEDIKHFNETLEYKSLKIWFSELIDRYMKWVNWQFNWNHETSKSIKQMEFPFEYRTGQKDLVTGVYKTIIRNKNLFIEAPTGVGKTITTLFPAVKAMAYGLTRKIFYLTAKTITRTVAEETAKQLVSHGAKLKVVTITAKDKICILDKPDCNPNSCERARGHFNRVNDAVFDMLSNEDEIRRDLITEYASKHRVCPFEMGLDITTWADIIICDYNYVFDPNVYLRRFFANEKKNDYVFLIDEAHNLVDRARQMFSGTLYKNDFLEIKAMVKLKSNKLAKALDICNKDLLKLKRQCDTYEVLDSITDFIYHLMNLMIEYEKFLQEEIMIEDREKLLELYMNIRHFLNMYELVNEKYVVYTDYDNDYGFRINLLCMDPSKNLQATLEKGRSSVFFSATLLPIQYYKQQLGGTEEDYAIYAHSPFDQKKKLLMIANDVSTKYSRRTSNEYQRIGEYIKVFTNIKVGNYMVFFPSYSIMNEIYELLKDTTFIGEITIQQKNMSEFDREDFLESFVESPVKTRIGFCVMGGIFSEGIDLKGKRLIGTIIVGTGLPMICHERELFREYYDKYKGLGFDYAYLYVGMNKVLQSAGRVIRTTEDRGAILLLDERFLQPQYQNLFPREWFPNSTVDIDKMEDVLSKFWKEKG